MAWDGSTRRSRLPSDWTARRRRVLARDKWCRACGHNLAAEVDHVIAGDDHNIENLAGVCVPCHARKSASEGAAASGKSRRAIAAARKRPQEPHPGGW
jgi:5-methylcytosine-specific restriction enzyme A